MKCPIVVNVVPQEDYNVVVTFETGGSPEIIDETCGTVVEKNDIDGMYNAIINVKENSLFSKGNCLKRAKSFDMWDKFNWYIQLFEREI